MTAEDHDASRTGLEVMLQHYLTTGQMVDAEMLHKRRDTPARA